MSTGINNGATCMVAEESSFGSVDATNARALDTATLAGLTWYSLRVTQDGFSGASTALKMPTDERSDITLAGGRQPLRVLTAIDASGPVRSITGDVGLPMEARGMGTNVPSATGLGVLLLSGCSAKIATPGASVTATYATANTFTVPSAAVLFPGDIVAVVQTDGTMRGVKISDVGAGAPATVTTVEPHGIPAASTATVRLCHQFFISSDAVPDGGSVAVQYAPRDGYDTVIGVGARLAKLDITAGPTGAVDIVPTLRCADGTYVMAPVATPTEPLMIGASGSTALRTRVAPVLVTQDHSTSSAPYSGTATTLPVREWSVSIEFDLVPVSDQGTRSRMSEMRVSSATLTGSMTIDSPSTTSADVRDWLRLSQKRTVGFSAAGANAAGNGCGVWVGSVEPSEDPGYTFTANDRTQVVPLRAGDYAGDGSTTTPTDGANTPWVLWFVA